MSRYGEWRAVPTDPKTFLGWLLADSSRRKLSPSKGISIVAIVALFAFAWSPWLLGAIPYLLLCIKWSSPPDDLNDLKTLPPPGPAFACRIESLVDVNRIGSGALVGSDEGIVTFLDGWLHVAGRRSDFAIRNTDLLSTDGGPSGRIASFRNGRSLKIVSIDDRDDERFVRALRLWSKGAESPEGESTFPPLAVHATGLARAWSDVLFTLAAFSAFVGAVLATHQDVVFGLILGTGMSNALPRLLALRKLVRQERKSNGSKYPLLRER